MVQRWAKCKTCGREYLVNPSMEVNDYCGCCGTFNYRMDAIRYYLKQGVLRMPEAIRAKEGERLRQYISLNFATATVSDNGSGLVNIKISIQNNSPVPLCYYKIHFDIRDSSGNGLEGNSTDFLWENERKMELLQNQAITISSKDVYLKGKDLRLQEVNVLIYFLTLKYANGEIFTINAPLIKYIRDDHDSLSEAVFTDTTGAKDPHNSGEKSWMVYTFLAVILGQFGVHNFYAHNTKRAVIQLLLTVTLIGSVFSYVWALSEAFKAYNAKEVPDYGIIS